MVKTGSGPIKEMYLCTKARTGVWLPPDAIRSFSALYPYLKGRLQQCHFFLSSVISHSSLIKLLSYLESHQKLSPHNSSPACYESGSFRARASQGRCS